MSRKIFRGNLLAVRRQIAEELAKSPSDISATPYTVKDTDSNGVLLIDDDTIGGNVTVNLPAAATLGSGFNFVVMKIGSTGTVTIDANGSETINGDATFDLVAQYESIRLVTNGTNWFIIEA